MASNNGKLPTASSESDATQLTLNNYHHNDRTIIINAAQCSNIDSTHNSNTTRFSDSCQNDCGSNQSGSDSGLGYTNSLSSDSNFLFNTSVPSSTTTTSTPASTTNTSTSNNSSSTKTRSEQTTQISIINNGHNKAICANIDTRCNNTTESGVNQNTSIDDKNAKNKPNANNNIIIISESSDRNNSNIEFSSTGIKNNNDLISGQREQRNQQQQWHNGSDETASDSSSQMSASPSRPGVVSSTSLKHTSCDRNSKDNLHYAALANVVQDAAKQQVQRGDTICPTVTSEITSLTTTDDRKSPNVRHEENSSNNRCPIIGETAVAISASPSTLEELVSSLNTVSFPLKSVLKKSHEQRDSTHIQHRNVSFNQTVIVYCEEVDTPASGDYCDPPFGYKDSSDGIEHQSTHTCEPPGDYSDTKESDVTSKNLGDMITRVISADASNITDDQLFGMLENESLLDTFKLDSTDVFDSSFNLDNKSDPSRGYLCNAAISDDSDTETSLVDPRQKPLIFTETDDARVEDSQSRSNKDNSHGSEKAAKVNHINHRHVNIIRSDKNAKIIASPLIRNVPQPPQYNEEKQSQRKSLPARMKVSAVETSVSKRTTGRKSDQDSKTKGKNTEPGVEINSHPAQQSHNIISSEHKQNKSQDEYIYSNIVVDRITNTENSTRKAKPIHNSNTNHHASDIHRAHLSPNDQQEPEAVIERLNRLHNLNSDHTIQQQQINPQRSKPATFITDNKQLGCETQTGCQLCKAAELQRSNHPIIQTRFTASSSLLNNQHPVERHSHSQEMIPTKEQIVKGSAPVPKVVNQSCQTCRAASINSDAKNNDPSNVEHPNVASSTVRPLAYQWVFLVDRNGNRIRALSVISQPEQANTFGAAPQRIILAPSNIRVPNHTSVMNRGVAQSQNPMMGNQAQVIALDTVARPYRIVAPFPSSAQNPGLAQQHNLAMSNQRIVSDPSKQHTVYYIRQPIRAESIRQPLDAGQVNSGLRSFPDAHEIRRLDGILAPSMSQIRPQKASEERPPQDDVYPRVERQQTVQNSTDPNEDPTFGFSQRPAVKVVSTNVNQGTRMTSNTQQAIGQTHNPNLSGQRLVPFYPNIGNQSNVRPVSAVLLGSQTVDRRLDSARHHEPWKENVPSTNSMNNISGLLRNNAPPARGELERQRIAANSIGAKTSMKQRVPDMRSQPGGHKCIVMMSFLDLSTASEEERRLISEILADTSVVNFVSEPVVSQQTKIINNNNKPRTNNPSQQQNFQNSSVPQDLTTTNITTAATNSAINISNINNVVDQQPSSTNPTVVPASTTTSVSQQSTIVPSSSTQIPPSIPSNDINSLMGVDLTSTQPTGYAMPPPPPQAHVTAFGHAPPTQIYGGAPIFQAYPHTYFIHPYNLPYNLPMPYMMPSTNNVVPTRQQAPSQSNQPTTGSNDSHSRSHSHQHLNQNQLHHQQHQPHHNHHHHHHHHNNQHNNHNHERSNHRHDMSRNNEATSVPKANKNPGDIDSTVVNSSVSSVNNKSYNKNPRVEPKAHAQNSGDLPNQIQERDTVKNVAAHVKVDRALDLNAKTSYDQKNNSQTNSVAQKTKTQERLNNAHLPDPAVSSTDQANSSQKTDMPQTNLKSDETKIQKANSAEVSTPHIHPVAKQATETFADHQFTQPKQNHDDSSAKNKSNDPSESSLASESTQNEKSSVWNSASSKSWADLFRRNGQAAGALINGESEHNNARPENLDGSKNQNSIPSRSELNEKIANSANTAKEQRSQEIAKRAMDKFAPQLAQRMSSYTLKHACPNLRPRGFINRGNGCYINSTLQALIACPPFYNLMREVVSDTKTLRREHSCTPILDSFTELFQTFPPLLDSSKKNKQSTLGDQRIPISQLQAEAIEPKCIYNVLGHIKSECLKGAQEDAEEFLSSVLNGLHEEMISLGEILQNSVTQNGHHSDTNESIDDVTNDDNLWREVGTKNRSLPIRTAKVIKTPIQEIFGGSLFSVRTAGKDRCGDRSPFFSLHLDISGDNVKTLQDAIKSFTAPEIINDFYCSKTKQKLDAHRKTSLDQLPPILILHLKQFIYTQDHGLKKVTKKIEYPIDFELPEYCLHEKNSGDRNLRTSKAYKLLAVVYHEGKEAVKGHYLTDIYHIGSSQWIRCDDSNLKVVSQPRIESSDSTRIPYILIYRRLDTLRLPINNHEVKRKP